MPSPSFFVFMQNFECICVHSISDYVDFKSAVEDYSLLPFCELSNDSEASMNILEHLEVGREREGYYSLLCHSLCPLQGMSGPPLVNYIAERGLEEVKFCLPPYKFL